MAPMTARHRVSGRRPSRLWQNRLARGKLTLLAGEPGIGKSQTVIDIIARISNGGFWPDGGRAPLGSSVILSAEDSANDTLRPRLEAAGGRSRTRPCSSGHHHRGQAHNL